MVVGEGEPRYGGNTEGGAGGRGRKGLRGWAGEEAEGDLEYQG